MALKSYAEDVIKNDKANESQDLSEEIALLTPTDTPLYTLVAGRGNVEPASDVTVTWREKELNSTRGNLKLEGADAGEGVKSSKTMKSNICQIMEKVTKVSGTIQAVDVNGITDQFLGEIEDRMVEMKRDVEWYMIQGTKTYEDANTNTPRQMDGLLNLIHSDNVIDLGKKSTNANQLEEDDLVDAMEKIWEAGASGEYFAFLNATEKRIVNGLLKDDAGARLVKEAGDNVLGVKVAQVDTDFGLINFVLDRHMPSGNIMIVDLDLVKLKELRSPFYEMLAKDGDYDKGHVLVENTVTLENSKAGAKIINIDS